MPTYPTSIEKPLFDRIEELSKNAWFPKPKRLPSSDALQTLIDIAFHASFMTEERRRPGFRLLYCNPNDLQQEDRPITLGNPFRTISIPAPRPLTASELNRVAPAADLTRFLVCVCPDQTTPDSLKIWGLLDAGDNWWKFIHHESSSGTPPPYFLAITSTSPGELSFSIGGTILLMLKSGELSHSLGNPIWSGPISKFLDSSKQQLYDQAIQDLETDKWDDEGADDDYPLRFYNFFVERILYNIRNLGHGGTVLLVPDEIDFDDPRLTDRIVLKYATQYDYAWNLLVQSLANHRSYYDLYFPLKRGKRELTMAAFDEFSRLTYQRDRYR